MPIEQIVWPVWVASAWLSRRMGLIAGEFIVDWAKFIAGRLAS